MAMAAKQHDTRPIQYLFLTFIESFIVILYFVVNRSRRKVSLQSLNIFYTRH